MAVKPLCERCQHEKGNCPNKDIKADDGDVWYCIYFEPKKEE